MNIRKGFCFWHLNTIHGVKYVGLEKQLDPDKHKHTSIGWNKSSQANDAFAQARHFLPDTQKEGKNKT